MNLSDVKRRKTTKKYTAKKNRIVNHRIFWKKKLVFNMIASRYGSKEKLNIFSITKFVDIVEMWYSLAWAIYYVR